MSRKIVEIRNGNDILETENNSLMTLFICGDKDKYLERFDIIEKKTLFYDVINITWSKSLEVINYLNCTQDFEIVLMKNIEDRYTRFDKEFTENYYDEWLSSSTSPVVMNLTPEKMQVIFQESIPSLIYHSNNKDKESNAYRSFYQVAKLFKV